MPYLTNFDCDDGVVTANTDYMSEGEYTIRYPCSSDVYEFLSRDNDVCVSYYLDMPDSYNVGRNPTKGNYSFMQHTKIKLHDKSGISAIKELIDSDSEDNLDRAYELLSALISHAKRIIDTDFPPFKTNITKRVSY